MTAVRIWKCFFRSVLTRFDWLERRQLDISPKKQYGAFTEKICPKKGKKHIFENFSIFFGNFQKFFILFLKNFRKCFQFCFEKFSKIFEIIFLKFSSWKNFQIYVFQKIFKSLNLETVPNPLVQKSFGRSVWVWTTSVSKSFDLETLSNNREISKFFQNYKFWKFSKF